MIYERISLDYLQFLLVLRSKYIIIGKNHQVYLIAVELM